jgi:hypothetical protein
VLGGRITVPVQQTQVHVGRNDVLKKKMNGFKSPTGLINDKLFWKLGSL